MKKANPSFLIIGINFYPEPTGIGKYSSEFAFTLAERNYPVSVITSFPYYPDWKVFKGYKNCWYRKEIIDQVEITRCPFYVPSSLSGFKRILQDISFFITAFLSLAGKMIAGKKYDVVFVPSPSFMSGFLGMFYCFFYRKARFIYHVQDLQIDAAEELGMIKSRLLLKLLKASEGIILKHADWVTTISPGMQAKINARPYRIKKQYLFPNWVDFGNIYKKEPDLHIIASLGLPVDKKICFYSGAVGEKQGLEMVLDVAKKASGTLPDIVFVIAGSGPYAQVLKSRALSMQLGNIFFIDLQPTNIFNEILNFAYVHLVIQKEKAGDLLLPSKLTNILAVEGLAIITASPGTSLYHIIHDNEAGIIISPGDAEALWTELGKLITFPQKGRNLKTNAGIYARKNLDKNYIISAFLKELGFDDISAVKFLKHQYTGNVN